MQDLQKLGLFLLVSLTLVQVHAIESQHKVRMNTGWEFHRGDLGSPLEAFREGKNGMVPIWIPVTLPHSYNAEDAVDPDVNYYQGPGWYRTCLKIDNPFEAGRTLLHFEGAGQKTQVYVHTQKVGSHEGGYDEFFIDITEAVAAYLEKAKDEETEASSLIPLAIRTDNSRDVDLIPSDLSDFNLYGGIYRYLNLVYLPPVSLSQVHIRPGLNNDLDRGTIEITANLYNPVERTDLLKIEGSILGPGGRVIESFNLELEGGKVQAELYKGNIEAPWLWSPSKPMLYTCELKVRHGSGTQEIREIFGFRHFRFEQKGPFYLNGERLLLRGTHRHEDHAGTGPAMTEEMIRKEMKVIKSMGVNFIRLGHYQQSRIVLEECDRLGILVWEEIPWCRGGLGGELYQERAREMLRNMIAQHYNHPSVIIWGLGNENDWPGDFEEFDEEKIRTFMKELNELSHTLDPTRRTAIRRCDFCKDIVDVYSPSIWAGWYRGKYTDYVDVSRKNWEEVDHFLHVEWGASHHAGRHSVDPDRGLHHIASSDLADEREGDFLMKGGEARVSKDGDWTESYAVNLIDWHLKEQEGMDWLTGTAYWPFKDFSTPLRPGNPVPYVNQKGVVERDLTPKESFYVFQSYWTEPPMARIYGHSWPIRWGHKGEGSMVKVYSNCSSAELFLNGISQGVRHRNSQDFPAAGLRWIVQYQEGKNELHVEALKDGITVEDYVEIQYQTQEWDQPSRLLLEELYRTGDTAYIGVKALDVKGTQCLDAREYVRFSLSGDGELIDNLGTSSGSRKVQMYNGQARIGVRMRGGYSVMGVASEGLSSELITIHPSQDADKSGYQVENITLKKLKKWTSHGKGMLEKNHGQAVMHETEGSLGFMLVSPQSYGNHTIVSYDVMALNPATVLVVELAAHNSGDKGLELDGDYDGNVKYLFEHVPMYMFAFHNAAHNKTGPFVRKYPFPGGEPLASTSANLMHAGKYYHVELGMEGDALWFALDGRRIWTVRDPEPYTGGKVILRIRGTAHETASCLVKNLKIYSK